MPVGLNHQPFSYPFSESALWVSSIACMDRVFHPSLRPPVPPLFRLHAIFRVACVFALMLCAFAPAQASECEEGRRRFARRADPQPDPVADGG